MPNKVKQEEFERKVEKVLIHTTLNEHAQYELITGFAQEYINSQVLEAIENIKSEQETEQKYIDGEIITYVLLSSIESIESEYK